jgi:hypothetical protein
MQDAEAAARVGREVADGDGSEHVVAKYVLID